MVQFERKMQIPTKAGGIVPNSCTQSAWPGCSWAAVQDPGSSLHFSCNFHPHCRITRLSSRRYSNLHSMFYNTLKILKGKIIIKKFPGIFCYKLCGFLLISIWSNQASQTPQGASPAVSLDLSISTTVGQIIHNKLFPVSNSPKRNFSPIILLN